jgi:hypothetical protein
VCRDLGAPLQALAFHSDVFRDRTRLALELGGSAWEPPGRAIPGFSPYRSITREKLVTLMKQESRGYTTADFPEAVVRLVQEIREDGALPVLLTMPLSRWGASQIPPRSTDAFEDAVGAIRARTGVHLLRGLELAPELKEGGFYVDYVEHLTAEGALILSRAAGRALGEDLQESSDGGP